MSLGQYFSLSYFFLKWSQPLALGTDEVNMFTMAGWTLRCHHQVNEIHKRLKSLLAVVF